MMKITLNGEQRDFDGPMTISSLTALLELDPLKVAVERNRSIVPRSTYAETVVGDGDTIEIVCFVGGG